MQCRRVVAALGRCAGVAVRVSTPVMRLCVYFTFWLSIVIVLLFCMCVARGTDLLFARVVAVLLLCAERLFARTWCRCRRVVTCATVAVSLACRVG